MPFTQLLLMLIYNQSTITKTSKIGAILLTKFASFKQLEIKQSQILLHIIDVPCVRGPRAHSVTRGFARTHKT